MAWSRSHHSLVVESTEVPDQMRSWRSCEQISAVNQNVSSPYQYCCSSGCLFSVWISFVAQACSPLLTVLIFFFWWLAHKVAEQEQQSLIKSINQYVFVCLFVCLIPISPKRIASRFHSPFSRYTFIITAIRSSSGHIWCSLLRCAHTENAFTLSGFL